jgi:hypothetical protein
VPGALAAGGRELRTGGRVRVNSPRPGDGESGHGARPLERRLPWLTGVADLLSVTIVNRVKTVDESRVAALKSTSFLYAIRRFPSGGRLFTLTGEFE